MSTTTWDELTVVDAERLIVGIALHDPATADEVRLEPGDFSDIRCATLWATARELHTQRRPTDPATILANLRGDIRGIDPVWVADLYGAAPVTTLADHYASIVTEAATHRRLGAVATRIRQMVTENVPAADAVEIARAEIDACSTNTTTATGYMRDHLGDMLDALEEEPTFTPTPWADLNHLIGGWRPGALYVIGARPGAGKTLMSTQAAVDIAAHGGTVALNNLEMSRQEVMFRVTAQVAGVHLGRILDRKLTTDDWEKITKHAATIRDLPLSIDDNSYARPVDIKAHARTIARDGNLTAIVVDYLQLMTGPPGDKRPRQEVVSDISRELKLLAKDMQVPVIALAQLNRNAAGAPPTLSDLRESGALEQDSDVVLLLHLNPDDPTDLNVAVAKNRHGATGAFQLLRRGHLARVDNAAWAGGQR
ncbi:replicative DNA helicase [Cellulosimicrobium sp. Marseille-Q8652]